MEENLVEEVQEQPTTNYGILLTHVDSMGDISNEFYGSYDLLDVDHVAAELMRQKLVCYWGYTDNEFIEEVENYRLNGYWEDTEGEWKLERIHLRRLDGFETNE